MLNLSEKAQAGAISALIFGVATLIIGAIIAFIIVSNVGTIDNDIYTLSAKVTVVNETVAATTAGTALTKATLPNVACSGATVYNASAHLIIASGNYTLSSGCSLSNSTCVASDDLCKGSWKVTYDYAYGITNEAATNMQANFTAGVDNISGKIPTVLLVAAIVLILGILAFLVGAWMKMRVGGGI